MFWIRNWRGHFQVGNVFEKISSQSNLSLARALQIVLSIFPKVFLSRFKSPDFEAIGALLFVFSFSFRFQESGEIWKREAKLFSIKFSTFLPKSPIAFGSRECFRGYGDFLSTLKEHLLRTISSSPGSSSVSRRRPTFECLFDTSKQKTETETHSAVVCWSG